MHGASPYSDRLKAIIRTLERDVRSGMTLEEARRELVAVLGQPDDLVAAAVEQITLRIRDIQDREIPRTMITEGRESWYLGPDLEQHRFWPALRRLLESEGWDEPSITGLDEASTKVVSLLDHPRTGEFRTRGLVLGYVQSGKTTNFTSVIAKAADAGYRLFIVLSGIHDGLRQQTQERLESQLIAEQPQHWITLTELDHDFRPDANVNSFLSSGENKVLGVVKKNGRILEKLYLWLAGAQPQVIRNCPTLIIDDEADQASINTARDQNSPTTINRRVREILEVLPKAGYVGYTATPFANVLIDPSGEDDLYPRDFIVDLPKPDSYLGSETIFGREPLVHDADDAAAEGLDMIRIVEDDELDELRPARRDLSEFAPAATPSLRAAIRYFLLSTAARRVRGNGNRHATMLVHTTMRTAIHEEFRSIIASELSKLRTGLDDEDQGLLDEMRRQWEEEIDRVPAEGLLPVDFEDVRVQLSAVASDTKVIVDNSRSEDRLSYGPDSVTAIAVGGNTLSRGLTLEGLCVSFFVRTTNAYDTLLQMGRWFGYRHGYEDLPRIWMTAEMQDWFRHLAAVEREIRNDIERYELEHLTPKNFGPKIATHPQLAITAASKMRAAVKAQVSYSGRRIQTIRFRHRDSGWLRANQEAAQELLAAAIAADDVVHTRPNPVGGLHLLTNVSAEFICEFTRCYRFSERSYELVSERIASYIETQNDSGELSRFTVAVMGRFGRDAPNGVIDLGVMTDIPLIVRSRLKDPLYEEADIKALMSKQDRAIDLAVPDSELASMKDGELARLRNSPAHRGRGDGSGLLLLYPIAKDSKPTAERSLKVREGLDAVENVIGVGLVFPEAQTTEGRQTYVTADLREMVIEEPLPEDELDEEQEEPAGAVGIG